MSWFIDWNESQMFDVPNYMGLNVPQKAEDIIFFSCDYDYFDRHGYALAQSINRT